MADRDQKRFPLSEMTDHLKVDVDRAWATCPSIMRAAGHACIMCRTTKSCDAWLNNLPGAGTPDTFCPNHDLFGILPRRRPRS